MARLTWTTIQIPFGRGLDQKKDPRAASPPNLSIARDVHFELLGGLQPRPPFAAMSNAIFGGGTLANCRQIVANGDELLVFTDTALYSWNAQLAAWVLRGTHLACAVAETPRFATTGDQVRGDRAELTGTILYAWDEGSNTFAAALDKVTGSVLASPTSLGASTARPRLVALATKILLFVTEPTTLRVRTIDPANPATGIASAGVALNVGNVQGPYDVVRAGTQDLCVGAFTRTVSTSYSVFTVTPALGSLTTTKARTCDGPIAVSAIPDGTQVQVVRANGTNIQGDLLTTSTLVDVFTAQAVGTVLSTPVNQIAAAHRSVQNGGAFRCYAFWSSQENDSDSTWQSKSNWVDTANSLGTQVTFVRHLGVASRAFDYAGSVYVWLTFAGASTTNVTGPFRIAPVSLQNTYFLYRDDAFLVAKSVFGEGGGFAPTSGNLPGVALVSGSTGFAWCAAKRRRLELADGSAGFAAREPIDVTFTFDTNACRRAAQLGRTLYVAGGEILQYDGTRLVEVGFHVYPWVLSVIDASGGGSVGAGIYAYESTWRYQNAQGEVDRSTTATIATVTVSGNSTSFVSPFAPLTVTHKTAVPPAAEIWRSAVSPTQDAPLYLVTSNDPTALTNPNRYMPNDPTLTTLPAFNDFFSDATLTTKEANPENGGFLERLAPPAAQIVIATDTRLFLAGVAGDPNRVWPSREREDGAVASFHDELPVEVPRIGGAITAIWFQDEVLYVGRETSIHALPGVGLDNLSQGQQFGPPRIVSSDVGPVSQEAQALTPIGTLFKSRKGWQWLDRGGQVRYVGGAVASFDTDTVLAMHVQTSRHQVRILTNSRLLLWDYRGAVDATDADGFGQWAEWTIADGLHATMWQGQYVYLTTTGPKLEQAAMTGLTYGADVELDWIKLADLQGAGKVGAVMPLGEFRSVCLVRVRLARDYQYDGAGNAVYYDDKAWSPTPTVVGSALQLRHTPSASNGNCEAIKVRLTAVTEAVRASLVTTALSPQVATSGTVWNATWAAVASKPGEMGNAVSLAISFELGANAIDVRDHFTWNASVGRWVESLNRVGVRVTCQTSSLFVFVLEAAISTATSLITLTSADVSPVKTVNAAAMSGLVATASFSGGAYGTPTGEAFRLTGLGLEVGIQPGLNRHLPAGQKQ